MFSCFKEIREVREEPVVGACVWRLLLPRHEGRRASRTGACVLCKLNSEPPNRKFCDKMKMRRKRSTNRFNNLQVVEVDDCSTVQS